MLVGSGPPGIGRALTAARHPGLERRRHQPAGRAALRVPRRLPVQQPGHRRPRGDRHAGQLGPDRRAALRHRRAERPPHPLDRLLPDDAAGWRAEHFRAEQRRSRGQPGQPTRQPEGQLRHRRRTGDGPGALAPDGGAANRDVVGGLGRLGPRTLRRRPARTGRHRLRRSPTHGTRPGVLRPGPDAAPTICHPVGIDIVLDGAADPAVSCRAGWRPSPGGRTRAARRDGRPRRRTPRGRSALPGAGA